MLYFTSAIIFLVQGLFYSCSTIIQNILKTKAFVGHPLQVEKMVTREKYDTVCQELQSAMLREQRAQELLHEQSEQLKQIGGRLDSQMYHGTEKEKTINDAVQVR